MLEPYRVLELSEGRAALGTMILAGLGTDVIGQGWAWRKAKGSGHEAEPGPYPHHPHGQPAASA